jgi:Zn-dependent M28 family amino/carboxypeptidase
MLTVLNRITSNLINRNEPSLKNANSELVIDLRTLVEKYAIKRDIMRHRDNNARIAQYIADDVREYCDFVYFDTKYNNVVFGWGKPTIENKVVVGGHYDGPGDSPGADDNASAIAVLIKLAQSLREDRPQDIVLVAFNGEEHNLLGSTEMVAELDRCVAAVVLEMVGYFTSTPGSQWVPPGFPEAEFDAGDFLAIIGNRDSGMLGRSILKASNSSDLPVMELKIPMGMEEVIPALRNICRSDHYPFWLKKFPAVMLTDTAEFRNRNYHTTGDLPDTLNYQAMSRVVEILHDWATTWDRSI